MPPFTTINYTPEFGHNNFLSSNLVFYPLAVPDQADTHKNTTRFLSQPWPSWPKAIKPQQPYDSAATYPINYKQTVHDTAHRHHEIEFVSRQLYHLNDEPAISVRKFALLFLVDGKVECEDSNR